LLTQDDVLNPPPRTITIGGVSDERARFYRSTGLLRWDRYDPLPDFEWATEGRNARANPGVVVRADNGMFGYFAGPGVHVVDVLALGDPLLARLPAQPKWRIGHFERPVPEGYLETLQTGRNVIVDPVIGMKYERLKTITQEPLWTRRRWRDIVAMNLSR
jgi:arabinofuranosyltransferase